MIYDTSYLKFLNYTILISSFRDILGHVLNLPSLESPWKFVDETLHLSYDSEVMIRNIQEFIIASAPCTHIARQRSCPAYRTDSCKLNMLAFESRLA